MGKQPILFQARGAAWVGRRLLLLALAGCAGFGAPAFAAPTLAVPDHISAPSDAIVQRVLSPNDRQRYREIFALQDEGKWAAADRKIKKIENRLLIGHLLAQRYLHPTAYRSKFNELRRWLNRYADHPDARRIYKLARHRKPKDARAPKRPIGTYITGMERLGKKKWAEPPRSEKARRAVRKLQSRVGYRLRKGAPKRAESALRDPQQNRHLSLVEYDDLQAAVAAGYLAKGQDEKAHAMAMASLQRSGAAVASAYWTAGRAAWRLEKFDKAGEHFQALAQFEAIAPALKTAGAFWAARNEMVHRRPQNVSRWLALAADYPQTFYGILARRALGLKTDYRWDVPRLTHEDAGRIEATTRGVRALALIEIGQTYQAERELRAVAAAPELARPVLALANHFSLPSLSLRLSGLLNDSQGRPGVAYPIPPWTPQEGYAVDRALLYAIMHQESSFNVRAKSPAGAHGLMQLLPSTANLMVRGRPFSGVRRNKLYQPELNLSVGQKFILHLLGNNKVRGNLLLATASYNAGLGRVTQWQRRMPKKDDALLFIESLPSRETRVFVKRVFRNLWLYRSRLRQPSPSLDAILGGEWPRYVALDLPKEGNEVAEHGH